MIGGRRPLHGRKMGDRRVRVARPHSPYFRYSGPGQLVARQAASMPTSRTGRLLFRVKSLVFGRPLASEEEIGERLSKKKALAIFSSDAISSSAYATEEILRVLVVAGSAAFLVSVPVAIAIVVLLAVVSLSYRQVALAYPRGGGAYVVARENLAPIFGLIAAAALLIDYVMTVAVSTSSALQQLVSMAPEVHQFSVEVAVVVVALITIGNLRGLRESGNIFAVPTYMFVGLALLMVGIGVSHMLLGTATPLPSQPEAERLPALPEMVGILLLLKAFAGGSVALTGVEAIANGVPAFKPPESRNAAGTLVAMAVLLGVLFIGITVVAAAYQILPSVDGSGGPTVVALVATAAFGAGSPLFYAFQVSTALILFLAANTSFNAFPRLAAILAEDGYMPRQFAFRGDRLAYSWGIILLAAIAALLIVAFQGDTHALIPLYSVGVFVCFTLSQLGMVRYWLRTHAGGWWWRLAVNLFGGVLTLVVLLVVASVKFSAGTELAIGPLRFSAGANLVVILIPVLVLVMLFVRRQYARSAEALAVRPDFVVPPPHREDRVVIPVPGLNRAVVQAVNVARSISDDVRAVYITDDPDEAAVVRESWERQVPGVPLVVVESPYRALAGPLVAYLDVLDHAWPPDKEAPITFVVVPEYVARNWWERILYNQSSKRLRTILLGRPYTVVVNVPYRREEPATFEAAPLERDDDDERQTAGAPAVCRPVRRRWYRDRRPGHEDPARGPDPTEVRPRVGDPDNPPFKRAVLALNGGPTDARTVRLVAELARLHKAELFAVHVVEIDWTLPLDADIAGASDETQRVLDMAEAVAEQSRQHMEPILLQARDVGAALVDEALERRADLLVLGLPYRKRFGGDFAIGRTIPYVLKNAPCAVWVVREPIPEEMA